MGDVAAIVARLDAISEELAEMAYAELSSAASESACAGQGKSPHLAEERRLTRARHAVERAAGILGGATGAAG